MKEEIVIFGYSGHAFVVNDSLSENQTIIGYIDTSEKAKNVLNLNYLGNDDSISKQSKNHYYFPAIGNNQVRSKIIDLLFANNLPLTTIIHQTSVISNSATIQKGTLVGPGVIINAYAIVGKGVILNSGSIIEHECNIGDCVHIAPGAVLAGNVSIGNNSFIGANSTIKEGVAIGENVIIAAGSTVLENIPSNEMWAGSPAKKKKNVK